MVFRDLLSRKKQTFSSIITERELELILKNSSLPYDEFFIIPDVFELEENRKGEKTIKDNKVSMDLTKWYAVIRSHDYSAVVSSEYEEIFKFKLGETKGIYDTLPTNIDTIFGNNIADTQYDKNYEDSIIPSSLDYTSLLNIIVNYYNF